MAFRAMRGVLFVSAILAMTAVDADWWRTVLVLSSWWAAASLLKLLESRRRLSAPASVYGTRDPLAEEERRALYMNREPRLVGLCERCGLDYLGVACPKCAS